MADLGAAVFTRLSTTTTITNIVATRIYPQTSPQGSVFPQLVYYVIGNQHQHTMDGPVGMTRQSLRIECYATQYADVAALRDAVRLRFDGFRGTIAGVEILAVILENDYDQYHRPDDDTEIGVRSRVMDFIIWTGESRPT
jgi:hypothetical protein